MSLPFAESGVSPEKNGSSQGRGGIACREIRVGPGQGMVRANAFSHSAERAAARRDCLVYCVGE